MITTISSNGQILIPKPVRVRQNIRAGDDLLLFELSNGDILLRQMSAPKKIARLAHAPNAGRKY